MRTQKENAFLYEGREKTTSKSKKEGKQSGVHQWGEPRKQDTRVWKWQFVYDSRNTDTTSRVLKGLHCWSDPDTNVFLSDHKEPLCLYREVFRPWQCTTHGRSRISAGVRHDSSLLESKFSFHNFSLSSVKERYR